MRLRPIPLTFAVGAVAISGLGACSGPEVQEGVSPQSAIAKVTNRSEAVPAATEAAPSLDIHDVDLANATWVYSKGGIELPTTLTLVNGAVTATSAGIPVNYALENVVYGDVDGDGDQDAVASISQADGNGYERLWYVWLTDGDTALQVKYPLARTSRCGTAVDSVVPGNGGVIVTQRRRLPVEDDALACSEPGTGLQVRTITVYREGTEAWPVQTSPVPAWGGLCPNSLHLDAAPGLRNLFVAASVDSPAAAVTGPNGAVFDLRDAPLMSKDGWILVGFIQPTVDVGVVKMQCAWMAS